MKNNINYVCKDCNHSFDGDDFTEICPNCSSANIVEKKSGPKILELWQKIPKQARYAIGAISILILLMNLFGDDSKSNQKLSSGNYKYEVNISNFDKDDKSISLDLIQLSENNTKTKRNDLIKFFNFKVINYDGENEYRPIISSSGKNSTAKIYPCVPGSLDISWSPKKFKLKSPQKRKSFPALEFESPNTKANCKLNSLKFISVDDSNRGDGCYKKIKMNYSKNVWISISGKNGKYYKDEFEFNFRNFDTYDLWAFHKYPGQSIIDTLPFQQNSSKIIKGDKCISCNDKKEKLLSEFKQAMGTWLINPKDKVSRNKILSLTHRDERTFYIDDNLYDFEGLYVHIRGNYEDEKYKLDINSIILNNNICKIKSFKVNIVS